MKGKGRTVLDLKSQDLDISDMEDFRKRVISLTGSAGKGPEELIMFSSRSEPYQYDDLPSFKKDVGNIPDDASYFYYTLTFPNSYRCSLYLDPDRPGKVVIEGGSEWSSKVVSAMRDQFPKGGIRYKVHEKMGYLIIWGIVLVTAFIILGISHFIFGIDPLIISTVLLTSGVLGTYLSLLKTKELQPANTISFVKRRKYWVETLLHFLTIVLGIISAILAAVLVEATL